MWSSSGVLAVASTCLLTAIFQCSSAARQPRSLRDEHAAELFRLAPGQNAPEHDLIFPRLVHPVTGDHLSHDIRSHRTRRSVSAEDDVSDDFPILSLKFSGLGEDFHVKVSPNHKLIPETFLVKSHRADGSETTTLKSDDFLCHHHGIAVSHSNSHVALSVCDGVSGTVYNPEGGSFMIYPIPDHMHPENVDEYRHATEHKAQPHVIYRRDVDRADADDDSVRPNGTGCHVHAEHQLRRIPMEVEGADMQLMEQAVQRVTYIKISDPHPGKDRRKRQADKREYHLEVMLVADNELFTRRKFRSDKAATNYLLAVANLASLHFNAEQLDVDIAFVVSKILLLNRSEAGLNLGHHSEKALSSFCTWQLRTQYTPYESDPDHYDLAILITGWQLCSYSDNRGCDELGRAYVSGACFKFRMCSVVYDNGLTAGFVMAHETGHSLGLRHDGENGCRSRGSLMSPTIAGRNQIYFWSECSRSGISRFVNSPSAYCLLDTPKSALSKTDDLAGRRYTLDQQCKLWMGSSSRFCPYAYARDDVCRKLWCQHTNANCRTANVPAAAGTRCGYRRGYVCYRGDCVPDNFATTTTLALPTAPPPKVGVWSSWRAKGNCSRMCGGGIRVYTRFCVEKGTQIKIETSTCKGAWLKREACNKVKCPQLNSFLKEQCKAAGENRSLRNTTWFPGYLAATRCRLVCKSTYNASIDQMATDGTPCSYRYNDRCISGKCVPMGCDFVEHSRSGYDKCGVCSGTGSTCRKIEQLFTTFSSHPHNVTTIRLPKGARSIYIKEHVAQSTSHLLLTTLDHVPVLDGYWMYDRIHTTLRVFTAGTEFFYRQVAGKPESLSSAVAPINEDLLVKIVRFMPKTQKLRIRYFLNPSEVRDSFDWVTSSTDCSVTCGKGYYTQFPVCKEKATGKTFDSLYCIPSKYRVNMTMTCSRSACPRPTVTPTTSHRTIHSSPAEWKVGGWSACPATCGGGYQTRRVACRRNRRTIVRSDCDSNLEPQARRECGSAPCPVVEVVVDAPVNGDWSDFSPWGDCSLSCGGGIQYRSRTCTNPAPSHGGSNCTGHSRERRVCHILSCPSRQPEMRTTLCAELDNSTTQWTPHASSVTSCSLLCRQVGENNAVDFGTPLPDGARCHIRQNDRCISGACQGMGCDNIIGGEKKYDKCGVCGGSGSTCQENSGRYSVAHALPGLYQIASIPRSTRLLAVAKLNKNGHNQLVFQSTTTGKTLYPRVEESFTGFRGVTYVPFSNGYVELRMTKIKEVFTIIGPLGENVKMLLNVTAFSTNPTSPGLMWRYTVDNRVVRQPRVSLAHQFERVLMVSGCSVTCGKGVVTMRERCLRRSDSRYASHEYCRGLPPLRASKETYACYREACPVVIQEQYEWVAGDWKTCTKTCGRGMQSRDVECQRLRDSATVSTNMCLSRVKLPVRMSECNTNACPPPPAWVVGAWKACPVTCGGGVQLRKVECEVHAPGQACFGVQPAPQRNCGVNACPVQADAPRTECADKLNRYYCQLVRGFHLCSANQRYREACCRTCSS